MQRYTTLQFSGSLHFIFNCGIREWDLSSCNLSPELTYNEVYTTLTVEVMPCLPDWSWEAIVVFSTLVRLASARLIDAFYFPVCSC